MRQVDRFLVTQMLAMEHAGSDTESPDSVTLRHVFVLPPTQAEDPPVPPVSPPLFSVADSDGNVCRDEEENGDDAADVVEKEPLARKSRKRETPPVVLGRRKKKR